MMIIRYILPVLAMIMVAGCNAGRDSAVLWDLCDADISLRRGEVYRLPFQGGSADYGIDNDSPETVEVMAVASADRFYPGRVGQLLVFTGRKTGSAVVRVRDNKTRSVVCYRLKVVDPYIALAGSVNTNPEFQDSLLAWDTNLYLSSDGRFLLTTFTDGMAVKPAYIARGTYESVTAPDGERLITLSPTDLRIGPQTYRLPDSGALAEIMSTWDVNREDSDLDFCTLPNVSDGRHARYWVTPSLRLPPGMSF